MYAYLTAEDNRIVRFRLGEEPEPILTGIAAAQVHNGGRIAFGPDGMLYAGTGDTGDTSLPQDPGSLNGKILRMEPDGSVPDDNPGPTLVWSSGHRNVQGLAWDADGRLWATEFGQSEVDEVNLIRPGANYGWPDVEGAGGGEGTDPVVTWPTSEASPSGAAIVGDDLYVAALRGQRLWRVPLEGEGAGAPVAELDGSSAACAPSSSPRTARCGWPPRTPTAAAPRGRATTASSGWPRRAADRASGSAMSSRERAGRRDRHPRKGGGDMGHPVVHFEIIGKDGEALKRYYAQLFGWEIDSDNPLGYGTVQREGNVNDQGAGIGGGIAGGPDGYPATHLLRRGAGRRGRPRHGREARRDPGDGPRRGARGRPRGGHFTDPEVLVGVMRFLT